MRTNDGLAAIQQLVARLTSDPKLTWQESFLQEWVGWRHMRVNPHVKCVGAVVDDYVVTLVFQDDQEEYYFLVASDDIALGYPFVAIHSTTNETSWLSENPISRRVKAHIETLDGEAGRIQETLRQEVMSVRVAVRGHANFAHVLLQVVPAIERLIELTIHDRGDLHFSPLGTEHPLGAPEELFPEIEFVAELRSFSEPNPQAAKLDIFTAIVVPATVGVSNKKPLMQVTRPVRRRVRRLASAASERPPIVRAIEGGEHDFVLWLSLRGLAKRTPSNFIDFASLVLARLVGKFSNPAVIFDGLSIQAGYDVDRRISGAPVHEHLSTEHAIATLITGRCVEQGQCPAFYDTIGVTLNESIQLAELVHGYVVHDGSTQHKIGWLYPATPGIVHGPKQRNVGQGFAWHPVSDGTPPIYVPVECIVDEKPLNAHVPHANYGYRLVDFPLLTTFIDDFLHLSSTGGDANQAMYDKYYGN